MYGFLFGTFVWAVIVEPYKRYIDLDRGSYLPEFVFSICVAALFMTFLWIRVIMVLFLPNLMANATQNYVVVMIFIALFSNPVTNITLNAVESVRVIGCSLTMTFEQLKEKTRLILSPILEIMKDNNETDLDPLKQDLLNIQQIVVNMKQEAEFNRNLSNVNSIFEQIKERQTIMEPIPDKQVAMNEISERLKLDKSGDFTNQIVDKTREVIEDARVEFDKDNFGLKVSLDRRVFYKQLAESRKLLIGSGGKDGGSVGEFNLTGIMYENCLGVFRKAKPKCYEAVEDMRASCHEAIGSFLGTLWCSPITFSLSSACPWLMNQLIDESSLCGQMFSAIADLKLDPFNVTGNKTANEVYKDLTKQLVSLDDESSPVDRESRMPQRLELSVTFNDETRKVFLATRDMLDFITNRYRLRKFLFDLLWFIYDVYTTITFFKIIYQANEYRKNYTNDIRYDNYYITGQFVNLDRRRRALGKDSLLPLTNDERNEYITTFTCKRRTSEEKETQCASCMMIIMFLAFVLALIYFDDIFYSLLISIHDHALIYYKEIGHHELEINVKGEGAIARLVKRLTNRLSSVYDLNRLTSTEHCLPNALRTTGAFYLRFTYLIVIYLAIDQISIYAMRLRRLTAAFFYPDKEEQRVVYLYNLLLIKRRRMQQVGWNREIDDNEAHVTSQETVYTVKDIIAHLSDCVSRSLACRCCDKREQKRVKL